MKTAYFYLDTHSIIDGQEHYIVVKSSATTLYLADEKVIQWAKARGLRLAGGYFVASCKPYNFKTNYTVRYLPKYFKAKAHKEDFVDRLMAHEDGRMNKKQVATFFKELKTTGIGQNLQGHYSSRM